MNTSLSPAIIGLIKRNTFHVEISRIFPPRLNSGYLSKAKTGKNRRLIKSPVIGLPFFFFSAARSGSIHLSAAGSYWPAIARRESNYYRVNVEQLATSRSGQLKALPICWEREKERGKFSRIGGDNKFALKRGNSPRQFSKSSKPPPPVEPARKSPCYRPHYRF